MTTFDDLRDAEQLAHDRRRDAIQHRRWGQLEVNRAERTLARMEMGDDVDD